MKSPAVDVLSPPNANTITAASDALLLYINAPFAVTVAVENVKSSKFKGILGINIGKNADTPVEEAVSDYLICLGFDRY